MAAATVWSPDAIEKVYQSLLAGATFGQIGAQLGFSPGAVKAIVLRSGMTGLSQHRLVTKPQPIAKPQRTEKFWIRNPHAITGNSLRDLPIESSPQAKCWEDFRASVHCHWPLGGKPFQFCGKKRAGKFTSYCRGHHARSLAQR
jgi:hypothetical protein